MGILTRLATREGLVRLTYGMNRLWNAAALRLPGAKRQRDNNRRGFEEAPLPQGRIHGQQRQGVAQMRYGRFPMSYNGCEVIAVCNALQMLGLPEPLGEVAEWFERKGIVLGGLFGSHVLAVPAFFRERGIRCHTLFASAAGQGELDRAFADCPAAVFSYWNNAHRLRDGLHTVALSHRADGGMAIDNYRSLDTGPCTEYVSIAEMVEQSGCAPVLLVTAEMPGK